MYMGHLVFFCFRFDEYRDSVWVIFEPKLGFDIEPQSEV